MHPTRGTRIHPKGLQSPLEGRSTPQRHRANKGSICRCNMLDFLLKVSPLRARGRGPFTRVRGRCSLRTSPLRSSLKFGLCNNLWEMHWPGTIDTRAPAGGKLLPSARAPSPASPYSILSRYDLRLHRSLPLPAVHYYRVDERRQPDHDDEDVDDAG